MIQYICDQCSQPLKAYSIVILHPKDKQFDLCSDECAIKWVNANPLFKVHGSPEFCLSSGAGIGKFRREGEGTCEKCDKQ